MMRQLVTATAIVFALSFAAQVRAQESNLRRTAVSERATVQYLLGLKQIFEQHEPAVKKALENKDLRAASAVCRKAASKIVSLSNDGVYPDICRCGLKTALLLQRAARILDEVDQFADTGNALVEGFIAVLIDLAIEAPLLTPMVLGNRTNRAQQLEGDVRQWQRDVEKLQEEWVDALMNAAKYFNGN
jgi:hypothetical protein